MISELIDNGYTLDGEGRWLPPFAIVGDSYLTAEGARAHLRASRELADDVLRAATEGDGYVNPLTCPDVIPQ